MTAMFVPFIILLSSYFLLWIINYWISYFFYYLGLVIGYIQVPFDILSQWICPVSDWVIMLYSFLIFLFVWKLIKTVFIRSAK